MGVCPLIFLLFAFVYVKRALVAIYGLIILCLILFSLADATVIPSIFYYFFPGAKVYRHIGLLLSTIHFFGIFCAVCGYDQLISSSKEQRNFYINRVIAISSGVLLFIWFINKKFRWKIPYDVQWHGMFFSYDQFHYISVLSVIILLIILIRHKHTNKILSKDGLLNSSQFGVAVNESADFLAVAIFSVIILEISSYAFYMHNNEDLTILKDISKLSSPRVLENNLWRENNYSENMIEVIDSYNSSKYVRYSLRDAFLGRSLCVTNGRVDLLNTSMYNLLSIASPNKDYKEEKLTGWNKLRNNQVISDSQLMFKELYPEVIQKSLGCVDSSQEAHARAMNGIYKINNVYAVREKDASIFFEYDKPSLAVGLQVFGLSDIANGKGKIYILGSNDKLKWQNLASFSLEDFANKTFIESAWFSNHKNFNFYKLQFNISDSPSNVHFTNIKLRTEMPIGYFANKVKYFNDKSALANYLGDKYSSGDEIKVTSSSQHMAYGPEGILSDTKIWHSAAPVKFPQYLNFDFPHKSKVTSIKILPQDLVSRAPSEFSLIGSNDKTHWDILLSVTKNTTLPEARKWLEYSVDSQKNYKYFRLVMNDNYGDPDFLTVQAVKFNYAAQEKESSIEYPVALYGTNPLVVNNVGKKLEDGQADTLVIKSRSYNNIMLHGFVNQPGAWFIWKEAWHPDWQMYIDNKPVDILRADMAFMSAWVEPGEHDIVLKFAGNSGSDKKYAVILTSMLPFMALLLV